MATLKDVAKASGLTVGTVSRVLNERTELSAERDGQIPVEAEE